MSKIRFASVWLGGCSGCHMSFLDLDEWLIDLAAAVDVVYSPVVDPKVFPENVDITLVEGAIANEDHLQIIHKIRKNSKLVVSFGDCAVTGNVTAMRNPIGFSAAKVLERSYLDLAEGRKMIPSEPGILPILLDRVDPLHAVITVDYFLPGCPPPAAHIRAALEAIVAGRKPVLEGRQIKFG